MWRNANDPTAIVFAYGHSCTGRTMIITIGTYREGAGIAIDKIFGEDNLARTAQIRMIEIEAIIDDRYYDRSLSARHIPGGGSIHIRTAYQLDSVFRFEVPLAAVQIVRWCIGWIKAVDEVGAAKLALLARPRINGYDWGVNAARLDRWLQQMEHAFAE